MKKIEWEFEEEEIYMPQLRVGDIINIVGDIEYWSSFISIFNNKNVNIVGKIIQIDKSENIENDYCNKFKKNSIPYNGWLFRIEGYWPWFKINENIKIKTSVLDE